MAIEIAIAISNLMEDRDRDRDRNFRDRVNTLRMYEPTHLLFYFAMSPSLRCTPNYPIVHYLGKPIIHSVTVIGCFLSLESREVVKVVSLSQEAMNSTYHGNLRSEVVK